MATGSGFIDLAGLTPFSLGGSFPFNGEIFPSIGVAVVGMGTASTAIDQYSGASGPATLGPGLNDVLGTIGSGDLFGIDASGHIGAGPVVVVPAGYVSGASLSGSATFDATFASLGLTPGLYLYSWIAPGIAGVPPQDGNLLIDVVTPSGVPETGTWIMMLIGFAGLGASGTLGRKRVGLTA